MNENREHILADAEIRSLLAWYGNNARELPWRKTRDPYKIWLSEIMLQQTRISAVLDYYARFIKALPDLKALAEVSDDELMKLWQGLGYYSRARNLKKAAQILVKDYGGEFPRDWALIRALPGIGDYTAGAIASIAFDLPAPAVDGNVLRVLTRFTADESDIAKEGTKAAYRARLAQILPEGEAGQFNQALMELGERVCLPNGAPDCKSCPLKGGCRARKEESWEHYPVKTAAKARRVEKRTVWLILRDKKVALRKRGDKGLLAGLWELPNILEGEDAPLEGLKGIQTAAKGVHIFSHIEWHMTAFCAQSDMERLPEGWVWASAEELEKDYALPSAFRFVREFLKEKLS